jgi:hypothetical protein
VPLYTEYCTQVPYTARSQDTRSTQSANTEEKEKEIVFQKACTLVTIIIIVATASPLASLDNTGVQ